MSGETVLWVDNDRAYLFPYIEELEDQGFVVTVAETAYEAERILAERRFDFVIIDVMIPTKSDAEEEVYTPVQTNQGFQTGLVFWRRMKPLLHRHGSRVLVFTVRLDEKIRGEFAADGLSADSFATKFQLNDEDPLALVRRLQGLKKREVPSR
jgi:CheY-like chemotaxis protein